MYHPELQNIIKIEIDVYGRVTQADIIGAVFGQTEEVLGDQLDLRTLQKANKIGRIEVETEFTGEKTVGIITIPSYVDKINAVIIAAALETITKIGPCRAAARVLKIVNIKELKIKEIVEHAKKVLEKFMSISVDSQELVDEVSSAVRMSQHTILGDEQVPCGPGLNYFDDVIFVETVEELKNLLRHGIKNVVAFEDCSKVNAIKDIASRFSSIVFIDRGKDHLLRRLVEIADVDNYTMPPQGKQVKTLQSKEIFQALRDSVSCEQIAKRVRGDESTSERDSSHISIPTHSFDRPTSFDKPNFERPVQSSNVERPVFEKPRFERPVERPVEAAGGFRDRPVNNENRAEGGFQRREQGNFQRREEAPRRDGDSAAPRREEGGFRRESGNNFRPNDRPDTRREGGGFQRRDEVPRREEGGFKREGGNNFRPNDRPEFRRDGANDFRQRPPQSGGREFSGNREFSERPSAPMPRVTDRESSVFKEKLGQLEGSSDAIVLDDNLSILGKLPLDAVEETISGLKVNSIIVPGVITKGLISAAEKNKVKYLVGKSSEGTSRMVNVVTNL